MNKSLVRWHLKGFPQLFTTKIFSKKRKATSKGLESYPYPAKVTPRKSKRKKKPAPVQDGCFQHGLFQDKLAAFLR